LVNGVEKSNVTNPAGTQSINSNKGNVSNSGVGMVKLEGYDEFMKDFEVVKTYQYEIRPKDLQITIRNKKLDSQELENFFLSIPEEKLKLYLSYFVLAKPQYLQYKNFCLVFY